MIDTPSLKDIYKIRPRFCRSVNLAADFAAEDALRDYIVTPLTREVLRRITAGLRPGAKERAWSIIGPYGVGKSACALFLAKFLADSRDAGARELLRSVDNGLYEEICANVPGLADGGFFVTLLVGSRAPLATAILGSLSRALLSAKWLSSQAEDVVGDAARLYAWSQRGERIPNEQVCAIIERAAALVVSEGALGLILIVDELGKLLEHAALVPAEGDVFLLQSLAESASRSGSSPFAFIGILHQRLEDYAARLGPAQQREWNKIQGRFETIGFLESPGEFLKLIAEAIEPRQEANGLRQVVKAEAVVGARLSIAPRELGSETCCVLEKCAPLHPTVAAAVGKLFRSRLAQNERSLFAFLTSDEPFGFQEFLSQERWHGGDHRPFYRLHHLYDYVIDSLGSGLYSFGQGKRWAEIEAALERLPADSPPLLARTVKTIGMLSLLGDQARLKASDEVLAFALADGRDAGEADALAAVEQLVKLRIAVLRRHKGAYGLWEGSDVDLDEWFEKAVDQIDKSVSLATPVAQLGVIKPYVAKRHLHETGTLRYFVPWVVTPERLNDVLERPLNGADGAIVFVIGEEGEDIDDTVSLVRKVSERLQPPRDRLLLFAVPRDTWELRQALSDVLAWQWVRKNCPDLEGDRTAQKELAARHSDAQSHLNEVCARVFGRSGRHSASLWFRAGKRLDLGGAAGLAAALSDACDEVYHSSPKIRNELVNRRSLSSAAAAARRTLIERMVTKQNEPRLGMIGCPPEMSIYRSVLEASGLHRLRGERWAFGEPAAEDPCRVTPLWRGIEQFLDAAGGGRRSVADLFDLLRRPPYGVKDGLLPIFFTAAVLAWQDEVALYENGTYLPSLAIAPLERLMKNPEQFEVQRYPLGEARMFLLEQYASVIRSQGEGSQKATLVPAVRSLVTFVRQLPPYTLSTGMVSAGAAAVREELLKARDPNLLLFEALPRCVGVDPARVGEDLVAAAKYFAQLKAALRELAGRYPALLDKIREQLLDALRLPGAVAPGRSEAAARFGHLSGRVTDLRLKAFIGRLVDEKLEEREWLESLGSLLVSKPPRQWKDQDLMRYGLALSEIANQLLNLERLVDELGARSLPAIGTRLYRLGLTSSEGENKARVIHITAAEEAEVAALAGRLQNELGAVRPRVREAVVAELARRLLTDAGGDAHEEAVE